MTTERQNWVRRLQFTEEYSLVGSTVCMDPVLPKGLQERVFRLIPGGFSLVLAAQGDEDSRKLGKRIGATVRKHHTGLPMEAEIDCVTGMKETRTVCHPNPVCSFEGCTQKSQYDRLNT